MIFAMKKVLLLVVMLNVFSVLSVGAQSTSELRQKAIAESKRYWSEIKAYNKSQDFPQAAIIDVDMSVKQLLTEIEDIHKSYEYIITEYYNCFDENGQTAVGTPSWEIHALATRNVGLSMDIHWKLLKLKLAEQAYFQNPADQSLRSQVLTYRREFKDRYFGSGYAD